MGFCGFTFGDCCEGETPASFWGMDGNRIIRLPEIIHTAGNNAPEVFLELENIEEGGTEYYCTGCACSQLYNGDFFNKSARVQYVWFWTRWLPVGRSFPDDERRYGRAGFAVVQVADAPFFSNREDGPIGPPAPKADLVASWLIDPAFRWGEDTDFLICDRPDRRTTTGAQVVGWFSPRVNVGQVTAREEVNRFEWFEVNDPSLHVNEWANPETFGVKWDEGPQDLPPTVLSVSRNSYPCALGVEWSIDEFIDAINDEIELIEADLLIGKINPNTGELDYLPGQEDPDRGNFHTSSNAGRMVWLRAFPELSPDFPTNKTYFRVWDWDITGEAPEDAEFETYVDAALVAGPSRFLVLEANESQGDANSKFNWWSRLDCSETPLSPTFQLDDSFVESGTWQPPDGHWQNIWFGFMRPILFAYRSEGDLFFDSETKNQTVSAAIFRVAPASFEFVQGFPQSPPIGDNQDPFALVWDELDAGNSEFLASDPMRHWRRVTSVTLPVERMTQFQGDAGQPTFSISRYTAVSPLYMIVEGLPRTNQATEDVPQGFFGFWFHNFFPQDHHDGRYRDPNNHSISFWWDWVCHLIHNPQLAEDSPYYDETAQAWERFVVFCHTRDHDLPNPDFVLRLTPKGTYVNSDGDLRMMPLAIQCYNDTRMPSPAYVLDEENRQ